LLGIKGIGRARQKQILAAWGDHKAVSDIMVFLHSHGVGTARAVRIYKTYGQAAIEMIRENPYRLSSDIHGIGFKVADEIARHLGVEPQARIRGEAGIRFVLEELAQQGHCAYPRVDLLERAARLLEMSPEVLTAALGGLLEEQLLVEAQVDGAPHVYLAHLHHAESQLAGGLRRLVMTPRSFPPIDVEKAIEWVQEQVSIRLAPSQKKAVREALGSKVVVITGGPGVGKTTLVNSLLRILNAKRLRCLLCAPTGRAARRLSDATGEEAKTIHRLLEFQPARRQFRHHSGNTLDCAVVILDEASMVDVVLMNHLVAALPVGATLVLVGDVDQLPSVGPGQVLRDLIDSGTVTVLRLTEVFRQADESRIVTNAHRIQEGLEPDLEPPTTGVGDFFFVPAESEEEVLEKIGALVKDRIPKRFGLDPRRDVQVLVPMNRSSLGARAVNVHLQEILNPSGQPSVARFGFNYRLHDKVMQIKNNYDKDVFNGDVGFVTEIRPDDEQLDVRYDSRVVRYSYAELDELLPAYACSVHKSQGSEYPAVVLLLHTQHFVMLQRNILYTAVTRAKRLVVIVGSRRALSLALRTDEQKRRISGLRERLTMASHPTL
jgi:exodeoxyribonuclease V alpha subunit